VEGGAGEEGDAAVVGGFVEAGLLVVVRDVAEEAGEDAAVDGAVGGGVPGEFRVRSSGFRVLGDGSEAEVVAVAEGFEKLRVDVAPLAHARVAEKVVAAEAAEFGLGEIFELVVVGLPDIEEREEVGVGVAEAAVGGVGLRLFVEGAFARILNRKTGGDDEDLAERALVAGLENHAADGGIDGEAGEFAADRGEVAGGRS